MIEKLKDEAQYNQLLALVETFIKKATDNGGFNSLSAVEADELNNLCLLVNNMKMRFLK